MAFTKIVGAGIHTLSNVHTHNINSSGIITATNFVGIFSGTNGDFSGNVSIGGSLTVNGDFTTLNTTLREVELLQVDADSTVTAGIITQRGSGNILELYDGTNERLLVTSAGKIGINESSPDALLHLSNIGSAGITAGIRLESLGTNNNAGDTIGQIEFAHSDANDAGVSASIKCVAEDTAGNTYLTFNNGNPGSVDERLRIDSSGRVMIGGTTAASTLTSCDDLTISTSGSTGITLFSAAGNAGNIAFGDGSSGDDRQRGLLQYHHSDNTMRFFTNAGRRMTIDSDGKVGIGTDNPTKLLELFGTDPSIKLMDSSGDAFALLEGDSADQGSIRFRADPLSSGEDTHIRFDTDGIERLRIDSTGDVRFAGTNLTNNTNKNVNLTAPSYNTSEEDVNLVQVENESSQNSLSFGGGTTALNSATVIRFLTASAVNTTTGTERLRITGDGEVGIGTVNPAGGSSLHIHGSGASDKNHIRLTADRGLIARLGDTSGSAQSLFDLYDTDGSTQIVRFISGGGDNWINTGGGLGIGTATVRNNRTVQITGESGTSLVLTGFAPSITFNGQSATDSQDYDRSMLGQASGSNHMINGSANGDTVLRGRGSGKLLVGMGSTVKMQLHANGKFGLGTYPSTGVDIGFDVHIKKGSGEPSGQILIQSHDTANSTAGIQLLARDNSNNNETCRILATSDSGETINLRLYTDDNSNKGMKINGSDGGISFVGSNSSMLNYTFQNATGNANSDTRLLIKTYSNQGADPYIMFDSGGTNHVVGQLYAGTTNNKLVLGAGDSPSGGVSGIHIAGDGVTQVTNHISMTKGSDPKIYSGTNIGLNIDGMALYLNRYVNSTIAMARGGGAVEVSNTNNGNDSQLNIFKSSGGNTDDAVLRVGYDSSNCLSIVRQRNSSQIKIDYNQNDAILRFQANGDDTMILTNRQMVNIAKLTPMVMVHREIVSNSSWSGSRPVKFYMRFSTGNFSATYHVARMITQNDWGFADWEARVLRDYYSPDTHDGALTRYTGYYSSHTDTVVTYNMRNNNPNIYGDGRRLSRNTNLGPNGSHKIHESANGGYYKDAYATDYYINLGTYSGVMIEVTVNNAGGFLKDQATSVTDIYPASFGNSASQSEADSWSYGRGLWFNVRQGVLDSSWTGAGTSGNAYNYGQQNLPTS